MKRRLVVHIGANKTGSSSIQLFLWTNRNALRERGILVPGQKFAASSPQRATTVRRREISVHLIGELGGVSDLRRRRDGFCCRNPECRRPTMRLHAHHEQQRSHGGSDDPTNLLGLCPVCHLRGVHSGAIEHTPGL